MICSFENVSKSFGDTPVLENVSLSLEKGVPYALCGASGAGKTTLLRLLCRLDTPDSGKILLPDNCRFSYAFQEPRLFENVTVQTNMELVKPDRSIADILAQLDLESSAHKYPSELSGGMQKRASLARALSVRADVYLIDEPTAGQDADHTESIIDAIRKYTADAICIVASHDEAFIRVWAKKRILVADRSVSVSDL